MTKRSKTVFIVEIGERYANKEVKGYDDLITDDSWYEYDGDDNTCELHPRDASGSQATQSQNKMGVLHIYVTLTHL